MKGRVFKLAEAHMKLALPVRISLVALLISIALVVVTANTHVPALPSYPGRYRYDVPWASNSSEKKPDAHIIIETSGEPQEVDRKYASFLGGAGWDEPRTCYSGIPGAHTWHHAGSGLFDQEGWTAYIEARPATNGMTDIDISIWKGPKSVVTCGEM
jgi:hypothetical protein